MPSLDRVPLGKQCVIQSLGGSPALVQRLLELGLLEGERVHVAGQGALGRPD